MKRLKKDLRIYNVQFNKVFQTVLSFNLFNVFENVLFYFFQFLYEQKFLLISTISLNHWVKIRYISNTMQKCAFSYQKWNR